MLQSIPNPSLVAVGSEVVARRYRQTQRIRARQSKARPSRSRLGRDDVRVLVVHRLERREVEVGRWVASVVGVLAVHKVIVGESIVQSISS